MYQLLKSTPDNKIKIPVAAAGKNEPTIEWSVNILHDQMELPTGMILNFKP